MIAEVDEGMSGILDFGELLRVIEVQKLRAAAFGTYTQSKGRERDRRLLTYIHAWLWADDEGDMVDAFVACGGKPDKTGHVKRETLLRIVKQDFGLMIDMESLLNKIDTDGYVVDRVGWVGRRDWG